MSDPEASKPRIRSTSESSKTRRKGSKDTDRKSRSRRRDGSRRRAESAPARDTPDFLDPPPKDPFRNYSYPNEKGFLRVFILFLELLALVLLVVLVLAPPNVGGGSVSVLRDAQGKEFVGVLRECSATTCDPWLGGSDSTSSSSIGDASGTTPPSRRSTEPSSTRRPFFPLLPIASVHSLFTRADSSGPDLPRMYLTTGLATLSALWILIYLFLFTFTRFAFYAIAPDIDTGGWTGTWKRLTHRATRIWLVVLCILLGAILVDVGVKGAQYRSAKGLTGINGIGPGIAIILFAWICCIICALIEFGGDRTHGFFNSLSCGSEWGCCCFGEESKTEHKKRDEEEGIPLGDMERAKTF